MKEKVLNLKDVEIKNLPTAFDPAFIIKQFLLSLQTLPIPLQYKYLSEVKKVIEKQRDKLGSYIKQKLKEYGIKTDKGFIMEVDNFLLELIISYQNRLDTKSLRKEKPDVADSYTKPVKKETLEVREIYG